MEIRDDKLDFWLKNNLNVLFVGRAGVGKTARVLAAFRRAGLRYKYFSAATMDPWVDFIGVPRVSADEAGQYLEMVLPKDLRDDRVEAIFFDEFNRSHKKVRNAVLELIQSHSINGRKFENLRVIWAAINPEDDPSETYQVEELDKAQKDRFHVWVNVPYEPSLEYFKGVYGERAAKAACAWWRELPEEQKLLVTPRRLDYAVQMYKLSGGDVRDVLPHSCNPSKLLLLLNTGPALDLMKEFFAARDTGAARKFLAVENNYAQAARHMRGPDELTPPASQEAAEWMDFFLPLLPAEKLSSLMSSDGLVANFVIANHSKHVPFGMVVQDVLQAKTNKSLIRAIKAVLGQNETLAGEFGLMRNRSPLPPHYNRGVPQEPWAAKLTAWMAMPMDKTGDRMKIYEELAASVPEELGTQEAVATLELLSLVLGRSWAQTLESLPHLIPVWNHCVDRINKTTNLGWAEMLNLYGGRFERLLRKIREAKLDHHLLCPVAMTASSSEMLDKRARLAQ